MYHPMRPLGTPQRAQDAQAVMTEITRRQTLETKKKNREKLTPQENKDLKGLPEYKGSHKLERALFEKVARYILGKMVLRYDATTGAWTQASLVDYSDSVDIQQMVTAIKPLVDNGLAAHIRV